MSRNDITKEEFDSWRSNEITRHFRQYLQDRVKEEQDRWLNGVFTDQRDWEVSVIANHEALSRAATYYEIANIKWEDFEEFNRSEEKEDE